MDYDPQMWRYRTVTDKLSVAMCDNIWYQILFTGFNDEFMLAFDEMIPLYIRVPIRLKMVYSVLHKKYCTITNLRFIARNIEYITDEVILALVNPMRNDKIASMLDSYGMKIFPWIDIKPGDGDIVTKSQISKMDIDQLCAIQCRNNTVFRDISNRLAHSSIKTTYTTIPWSYLDYDAPYTGAFRSPGKTVNIARIDDRGTKLIVNFLIANAKYCFAKISSANDLLLKLFQANKNALKLFWNTALNDSIASAIIVNDHPEKLTIIK